MWRGEGPALIEGTVVRLDPHSSSDDQRKYREQTELTDIGRYDPLLQTEQYLLYHGVLKQEDVNALRAQIKAEVDAAAAKADSHPEPNPRDVTAHIYAPDPVLLGEPPEPTYLPGPEVAMIDAINHGLREEMERNPKIVMWGEDIADPKRRSVWRHKRTVRPGRWVTLRSQNTGTVFLQCRGSGVAEPEAERRCFLVSGSRTIPTANSESNRCAV